MPSSGPESDTESLVCATHAVRERERERAREREREREREGERGREQKQRDVLGQQNPLISNDMTTWFPTPSCISCVTSFQEFRDLRDWV